MAKGWHSVLINCAWYIKQAGTIQVGCRPVQLLSYPSPLLVGQRLPVNTQLLRYMENVKLRSLKIMNFVKHLWIISGTVFFDHWYCFIVSDVYLISFCDEF